MHDEQMKDLLSLPRDVLLEVVKWCELRDVCSLEQTCKRLREICGDRALWTHLLRTVPIQYTPDIPFNKDSESLSKLDMRNALLSAARKDFRLRVPGRLASSVKVLTSNFSHHANSQAQWTPRLTPGGKHVFIIKDGCLELWSMENDALVWVAPRTAHFIEHDVYDFEFLSESDLVVAIVETILDGDVSQKLLRVFSLNLLEKVPRRAFECLLDEFFCHCIYIRGDYMLLSKVSPFRKIALVNWKKREVISLDFSDVFHYFLNDRYVVLGDGFIVALGRIKEQGFGAGLLSLESLSGNWHPVDFHLEDENSLEPFVLMKEIISVLHLSVPSPQDSGVPEYMITTRPENDDLLASVPAPVIIENTTFKAPWYHETSNVVLAASYYGDLLLLHVLDVRTSAGSGDRGSERQQLPRHEASLISMSSLPMSIDNMSASGLTNTGRMCSAEADLLCFSFLSEGGCMFPSQTIPLGLDLTKQYGFRIPPHVTADPGSGSIGIHLNGEMKVVYFQ